MEEGELSYVLAEPRSGNQTTIQVGVLLFLLIMALYKKKSRPIGQQVRDKFAHTVEGILTVF